MTDLPEQLRRAAGMDPEPLDLTALRERGRTRRTRRRAGMAGVAGTVVLTLGVLALTGTNDVRPLGQRLAAGQGAPDGDSSTSAPGSTLDPSPSSSSLDPVGTTMPSAPTTTATTATTAPSTTSTAATAPPPLEPPDVPPAFERGTGTVTLAGTYEGRPAPRYELTDRCPSLSHSLDASFVPDGTDAWRLREQYCGEVADGDRWSGAGTFTVDAGRGTLFGRFTSVATLPTAGEPYTLQITGGTGTMAGVTGSCRLDNHIRAVENDWIVQYGTFSCTIDTGDDMG